ncbi:MAG: hypothetical protein CM15mP75_7820 [Flammeovirgaceae bacterium]|nr:MAG: hypothetical protein CM15mP75_7820 [Flammeovirgaceae bacterium]
MLSRPTDKRRVGRAGGWYEDPLSASGWTHGKLLSLFCIWSPKNPNGDFAESKTWYVDNIDGLRSRSMQKYEFIRDRVMSGHAILLRLETTNIPSL